MYRIVRYDKAMKSTSFRLPKKTAVQLTALATKLGMTLTQVIILAIDRMSTSETDTSNYMEGLVTKYHGTTLVIDVDRAGTATDREKSK